MRAWLPALALVLATGWAHAQDTRRSGFDFMSPALQAMQRDDAQNPALLWVQDGEALWTRRDGIAGKSCADCHGDVKTTMRGVAARYPAIDAPLGRPTSLAGRVATCRTRHQRAAPWAPESQPLLALEALLALQSRGMPVAPPDDVRLGPFIARGEALWKQRLGQLDLSCAQCHDERAGGRLGGSTIPQAHPTGYPIYRLEWQTLASLPRRLRNCMTGVRAEPFAAGAREWVELELFMMQRARGMPIDAPGVRP